MSLLILPNIALTGQLRAGKDEVARILTEKYGYTRFAFGDTLKNDFHHRYPEIPREPKPRIGYQNHGQLMRELVDEDIWVSSCFELIDVVQAESMYVDDSFRAVITDLRQPNEYARCRAEEFVIIRVTSAEDIRIQRATASSDTFKLTDLTHETEQHTDGFEVDYEVINDGSLADLRRKVDEIMAKLTSA
ncbi:adenylate kinase [Paenibacillus sp. GCM10012307]|uniref:Adenylate kinase n=1 Tax=Paenibacillus roseus TaxID=2798579 RepID=A0A934JBN1_9BACL|nr:adenylate kinase [Paenibacillus roseus]MBJ6364176.1 adenylate kinase [Paenibacillus roseus]